MWVSCFVRQKLKEFSAHGQALRIVSLHPDISYPWHAVEFAAGGRVLVCHGGVGADGRRVVAVGKDGRGSAVYALSKSAGGGGAAAAVSLCGGGQTSSPLHAVVDADQFVVVLDCDQRTLTLLDPELGFVRQLGGGGEDSPALRLKDPRRLCLDNDNHLLYVGDGSGGIAVIQLK